MKIYMCIISMLLLTGMYSFGLTAQDQQLVTQSATGTLEPQKDTATNENRGQTQTLPLAKPKPFADELNISDQFSYAIDKSSNFQDYKVIKQAWMSKLKSNTLDTLQSLKTDLKSSKDIIREKTIKIDSLQSEMNSVQSDMLKKNSFKFFGFMISKAGYDSIMWTIIFGLIIALGFMFAAFRRSHAVTSQTKKGLIEVKEEFESFRKKALKSKEEVVRQLYDELNKYKNMK